MMGAKHGHRSQVCCAVPPGQLRAQPELAGRLSPWARHQLPVEDHSEAIADDRSLASMSWTSSVGVSAALTLPPWDEARYWFQSVLAPTSPGGRRVELYLDLQTGTGVVAKRFRSEEMLRCRPPCKRGSSSSPWREILITQCLGSSAKGRPLRGVCRCHGAFRDARGDALLVSEYCPGGDLFELASKFGPPGLEREAKVWPILRSLFGAVLSLHAAGVAHGDVSLENALWPNSEGEVVLVDFESVILGHLGAGTRGKPAYQAPEMHSQQSYDARDADLFSCGVAAYMLVVGAYPWTSTKPGECASFGYARRHGMEAFLRKKRVRGARGGQALPVGQCLSGAAARLVCGLLGAEPEHRRHALAGLLDGA